MEDKKYTITFTADEIRQIASPNKVTDEEVDEIARCLIDMFNSHFYEWVRDWERN